jgi:hypothetical protein
MPLLAPENEMSYDTVQFYNGALAIVTGSGVGALSFRLLPPLSPAFRTRRLLALTLRDLPRLAKGHVSWTAEDWEGRLYGRLAALPDAAEPLQRSQLLAASSVGTEIIQLRHIATRLGLGSDLDAALEGLAQGNSAMATIRLARLDHRLSPRRRVGSASCSPGAREYPCNLGGAHRACLLLRRRSARVRFAETDLFGGLRCADVVVDGRGLIMDGGVARKPRQAGMSRILTHWEIIPRRPEVFGRSACPSWG